MQAFRPFLRTSTSVRFAWMGFLMLLLHMPLHLVHTQLRERKQTQQEAREEVTQAWGPAQKLVGPVLSLPYEAQVQVNDAQGTQTKTEIRHLQLLPETLHVNGRLQVAQRRRGIFEIPVYTAKLGRKLRFSLRELLRHFAALEDIRWQDAKLVFGVSDPRAMQEQQTVRGQGKALACLPGTGPSKIAAFLGTLAAAEPGARAAVSA
ncbi:MAG: inner membrane CreD family protein, partial [Polyangiales bacterium]